MSEWNKTMTYIFHGQGKGRSHFSAVKQSEIWLREQTCYGHWKAYSAFFFLHCFQMTTWKLSQYILIRWRTLIRRSRVRIITGRQISCGALVHSLSAQEPSNATSTGWAKMFAVRWSTTTLITSQTWQEMIVDVDMIKSSCNWRRRSVLKKKKRAIKKI